MAVEYLATLTLLPKAVVVTDWTPEDTINSPHVAFGDITPKFTYSPLMATQVTWAAGGTTYFPTDSDGNNYYYVQINADITFTATVYIADPEVRAVEYFWEFGDGTTGYGNPIHKTFTATNMTGGQVILRVADTLNRYFYFRRAIYVHI